jgi:hypothetical protein
VRPPASRRQGISKETEQERGRRATAKVDLCIFVERPSFESSAIFDKSDKNLRRRSDDNYHFSVTVYTRDLAVVECLRALAKFSQETGNNQIPWGGTKDTDWRNADRKITLHFSSPANRERLKSEAARLLPRYNIAILPSLFWTLSVMGVAGQRVGANLLQLGS